MIPFWLRRHFPLARWPDHGQRQAAAEPNWVAAECDSLLIDQDRTAFLWLLNRMPAATSFSLERSPDIANPDDEALVARILAAYRRTFGEYKMSEAMWDKALWEIKCDVHGRLLDGSVDQVAAMLRDPGCTTLFWGFDALTKAPPGTVEPHELVLRRLDEKTSWMVLYAAWTMDGLISLAEAIGATRTRYPEVKFDMTAQAPPTVDMILDAIALGLGVDIDFPNPFPGEPGLPSKRGIVGFRAIQALYQAFRIRAIARARPDFRVLEIGAGLGRTAYYAALMGIGDYTIIDIPLTNVAQAYFLGRTRGQDAVRLYGEESSSTGVNIIPAHAMPALRGRFDLVLNVDSMTELSLDAAQDYYSFAKERSDVLLSINHEFNPFTMRSIYVDDKGAVVNRHPYWMRRGYVEEMITWPK